MFNLKSLFKKKSVPRPQIRPTWDNEVLSKSIDEGINALMHNKNVIIYDDGRGYELALRVKDGYVTRKMQSLSDRIHIEQSLGKIKITIK